MSFLHMTFTLVYSLSSLFLSLMSLILCPGQKKMLRLGLFCVLVGMVAAECGPLQIIRVKSQWAEAYGDGMHRDAFAQAVWRA
jgi:hypothetical protein